MVTPRLFTLFGDLDASARHVDRSDRGLMSQASTGADDECFSLGWVQGQAVTPEPVVSGLHTLLKNGDWVAILERYVQLCVVGVLDMVDAEGCDHIGNRWYIQAEQNRSKNGTLRYTELNDARNRLLITDPHGIETSLPGKTRSSPAHDREFRKWTPVYAGAYSSQSYRKRQRDRGGSRCSETSHPQPDRDRWGDAGEQFPWNGRDGRQTGNGWSWEKSSRDRWYFLRTIFRVSLRCC